MVSSSPLSARMHWTFDGWGGVAKSSLTPPASWCYTTECWPWTCPVCLPDCLISCHSATSAIASLHSFGFALTTNSPHEFITSYVSMHTIVCIWLIHASSVKNQTQYHLLSAAIKLHQCLCSFPAHSPHLTLLWLSVLGACKQTNL